MIQFRPHRRPSNDAPRRRDVGQPVRTPVINDTGQFRRNQTMSGIRRPDGELVSDRARLHNLSHARRKVGAILFLVVAVIVILGALMSQFTGSVHVTGSTAALSMPLKAAVYEKSINEYLALHPVERLRFALNQTALSRYVSNQLPEVAAVSFTSTDNIVESNFTLDLRKPVAGWQINNKQYYVDEKGIVFQNNYYDTPSVQIVDQSGIAPQQGSTVASARLLSFVGRVVSLAAAGGEGSYTVTQAILPADTTRQVQVRLKDVQPVIKLSIDRGAAEQVEDMKRAVAYLQLRGTPAQYIDVRVSGRAVYL